MARSIARVLAPTTLAVASLAFAGGHENETPRHPLFAAGPVAAAPPAPPAAASSKATFAHTALRFEANEGQFADGDRFVAQQRGMKLTLRDDGAELRLASKAGRARPITMKVAGGRAVVPVAGEQLVTRTNYFLGKNRAKWRTNVANYGRATYPGVRDGVDVVYHGDRGRLEYDFVVAPGASPNDAVVAIGGAAGLSLTAGGDLAIDTGAGTLVQPRPRVFQRDAAGVEHDVPAAYRLVGDGHVGFEVASYDRSSPLVIDPLVAYGTYLGGSMSEEVTGVAGDFAGNLYATGQTGDGCGVSADDISMNDFPTTAGAYQTTPNTTGSCQVFVSKLNAAGTALVYSTYVGGDGYAEAVAIAVDSQGHAYVTGNAGSGFPNGEGGLNQEATMPPDDSEVVFAFRLGATGSTLDYVVKLRSGESGFGATASGMALDGAGNVYVSGWTTADDFATPCPEERRNGNTCCTAGQEGIDGQCCNEDKIMDDGEDPLECCAANEVPTPASGQCCPTNRESDGMCCQTPDAVIPDDGGCCIGGTWDGTQCTTLDLGPAPIASRFGRVAKPRTSTSSVLRKTAAGRAAKHAQLAGGPSSVFGDAFVVKIDAGGDSLAYVTRLDTGCYDVSTTTVAVDGAGRAHVAGAFSCGPYPTYPYFGSANHLTVPIDVSDVPDERETFVVRLTADGAGIEYALRLGGGDEDVAQSIALDPNGVAYVAGWTVSSDFPTTNAAQTDHAGGVDAFVYAVDTTGAVRYATYVGGQSDDYAAAVAVDAAGNAYVAGSTYSQDFPTVDAFQSTKGSSFRDAFVTKVDASGSSLLMSSYLGGPEDDDLGFAIAVVGSILYVGGGTRSDDFPTLNAFQPDFGGDSDGFLVKVGSSTELAITPTTATVSPGGQVLFSASGGAGFGYAFGFVSNSSGATINATSGVYHAGPNGGSNDVVKVTDAIGATATATVTVGGTALALDPHNAGSAPRGTVTFTASGGTPPYQFSVPSNGSGGSIGSTGLYHAGANGSVVDVVQVKDSSGASVTSTVAVGPGVTIVPSTPQVAPNAHVAFSASGGSGLGYSWTLTSAPSGGNIDSSGSYTAGSSTNVVDVVQVTDSLGNTGTTQVVIGHGLAITPADPHTYPKGTIQFTAVGGSGAGYVWSLPVPLSGPSAQINSSGGLYTAGDLGNATDTIQVTDTVGNHASVQVKVGPPLAIDPSSSAVASGQTITFNVSGGSGNGYDVEIATNNSQAVFDGSGNYVAGPVSGQDTVVVTDSAGATATATVEVTSNPNNPTEPPPGTVPGGGFDAGVDLPNGGGAGGANCTCEMVGGGTSPARGAGGLVGLGLALALAVRRRRDR